MVKSFLPEPEVRSEINRDTSPGFPHIYFGVKKKGQWLDRNDDLVLAAKSFFRGNLLPVVYKASMKGEPVPIAKYLMRKQRMFMVMPVHAVVLHKHYFSSQSKALRQFREIAHGQTFFFGGVTRLARQLEGSTVQSEDDSFWDKRFVFMKEVYQLRMRGLQIYNEFSDDDMFFIDALIECLVRPIVLLPTGDVVLICERTNPSGADATTENNCIARLLVENYAVVCYCRNLGPFDFDPIPHRKATKYLGDDRIAGSRDYPPGYLEYYPSILSRVGVQVKTLDVTSGPLGAEFAGFKIAQSSWDPNTYVPLYKLEKIWYGLFVVRDKDINVTASRLMAFAFLIYPHYKFFSELKPLVLDFIREHLISCDLAQMAMDFWIDEIQIQRMWTGLESTPLAECLARTLQSLEVEV